MTPSCTEQIREFLNDTRKVAWFADADMNVYARKSTRLIEGKLRKTLDIATVEVREEMRCKRVFTNFINDMIGMNPFPILFVENIMTDRFAKYFQSQGWLSMGPYEEWQLPCYYIYT